MMTRLIIKYPNSLMSKLMLSILDGVAEFERSRRRQAPA
jgi:DNA invertase Pin-like site-specific DNA recombinase